MGVGFEAFVQKGGKIDLADSSGVENLDLQPDARAAYRSFHDPFGDKPAIRLSRKNWHFGASRAVVWLGATRRYGLVPGPCPTGDTATVGLRW